MTRPERHLARRVHQDARTLTVQFSTVGSKTIEYSGSLAVPPCTGVLCLLGLWSVGRGQCLLVVPRCILILREVRSWDFHGHSLERGVVAVVLNVVDFVALLAQAIWLLSCGNLIYFRLKVATPHNSLGDSLPDGRVCQRCCDHHRDASLLECDAVPRRGAGRA